MLTTVQVGKNNEGKVQLKAQFQQYWPATLKARFLASQPPGSNPSSASKKLPLGK